MIIFGSTGQGLLYCRSFLNPLQRSNITLSLAEVPLQGLYHHMTTQKRNQTSIPMWNSKPWSLYLSGLWVCGRWNQHVHKYCHDYGMCWLFVL